MTTIQPKATTNVQPSRGRGRTRKWLSRFLRTLLMLIAVLLVAGLLYQTVGGSRDRAAYPPPGQLVDVGGYRLHLYCTGQRRPGQPTVVLETLSGGISSYWGWIQPQVAAVTQVCSYDRAGRSWSEPATCPLGLQQTVDDLHTLLQNAGIPGPYVLVGHSIGGLYVRKFAAEYPAEVAGLVLVDAAHPDQLNRYPEMSAETTAYLRLSSIFPWLARIGVFRLYFAAGGTLDMGDLPAAQLAVAKAVWSTPGYFISQRAEMIAAPAIYADAGKLGDLGDLPLAVVSAGTHQPAGWGALQDELAALSTNSRHVTVERATHQSLAFNHDDALVTSQAILDVVAAVRSGEPLTP